MAVRMTMMSLLALHDLPSVLALIILSGSQSRKSATQSEDQLLRFLAGSGLARDFHRG